MTTKFQATEHQRPDDLRHGSAARSVLIDGEEWRAIGGGITFDVFGNGTEVVKVPLSVERLAEELSACGADSSAGAAQLCYRANLMRLSVLRRKIDLGKLPAALFGSPEIQRNGWIYQSRMTPLLDALRTETWPGSQRLVDDALAVITELVSWGAFASYVSLPVDFGVDCVGRVRAIGFGGLLFDRESAVKAIAAEPWRQAISGVHMLPTDVRGYFVSRAAEVLTPQLIDAHWDVASRSRTA